MIYYRKTLFGCGPKLTAVQLLLVPSPQQASNRLAVVMQITKLS